MASSAGSTATHSKSWSCAKGAPTDKHLGTMRIVTTYSYTGASLQIPMRNCFTQELPNSKTAWVVSAL